MGEDLHSTKRNRRRVKFRLHYLGSSLAQPLHCRASSPSVFLFRHHPYKPCCTTASRVTASWHSLRITPRCSGVGFTASIPLTDGLHTNADSAAPVSMGRLLPQFCAPWTQCQRLGAFPQVTLSSRHLRPAGGKRLTWFVVDYRKPHEAARWSRSRAHSPSGAHPLVVA